MLHMEELFRTFGSHSSDAITSDTVSLPHCGWAESDEQDKVLLPRHGLRLLAATLEGEPEGKHNVERASRVVSSPAALPGAPRAHEEADVESPTCGSPVGGIEACAHHKEMDDLVDAVVAAVTTQAEVVVAREDGQAQVPSAAAGTPMKERRRDACTAGDLPALGARICPIAGSCLSFDQVPKALVDREAA